MKIERFAMSYEPRSRGMRSRRTTTRKPAASRDRRGGQEYRFAYKEEIPANPDEISSRAMNALEHLGSQRFGMPPYSEHFRRWLLDVESVLNDFKASLPDVANDNFDSLVTQHLSKVRMDLDARIAEEETQSAKITESQGQLADNERKLARLDGDQRAKLHELKRASDKSMKKIRGEINALDEERLSLLRQKPTFLQRIFGGSRDKVDNSSRSIHLKRSDLENRQENLRQRMSSLRATYEEGRKPLVARQKELREELEKLRTSTLDDAVDLRKGACEHLREVISKAISQSPPQQSQEPEEGN
jgi:hypothetical protein